MSETRKNIQEELNNIAPILSGLKPKDIVVPAYYFENLQQQVMNKIKAEKAEKSFFDILLLKCLQFLKPQYMVPAFTIIILVSVSALLHISEKQQRFYANPETISEYLLEEELNMETIKSQLTAQDVKALEKHIAINFSEKSIINEVFLEEVDEEILINEYM
jgi:hypothetical protein